MASGLDAAFFEHRADDAFLFLGQGDQEMERKHNLAVIFFGNGLALLHSLLGFLSEFVQTKHLKIPLYTNRAGFPETTGACPYECNSLAAYRPLRN